MDTFVRADQLDTQRDAIVDVSLIPHAKKIRNALVRRPQALLSERDLSGVPRDAVIAVYGDSSTVCAAVVDHLRKMGYSHAAQLKGGFESWHDFGMPLEDQRYC